MNFLKNNKKIIPLSMLAIAMAVMPAVSSRAQHNLDDGPLGYVVQDVLQTVSLRGGGDILPVAKDNLADPVHIEALYQNAEGKLLWVGTSREDDIDDVIEILEESWTHGLNPSHYHVDELKELSSKSLRFGGAKERLDMLLTDAVMRYGHDITGMRVNPSIEGGKASYWRKADTHKEVMDQVLAHSDAEAAIAGLAPQSDLYNALRKELVRLNKESGAYDHILPIKLGKTLFRPGDHNKDVKKLRERLNVSYDPRYGSDTLYDDKLAAAVLDFQKAHNLNPDGVIGPKTLDVINKGKQSQMEQIIVNLERLRWMAKEQPDRYILVNIPSQRLWAIENGDVKHEMVVVVGMPSRATKSFKAQVSGVRFNPTWTVPYGIKMRDFLPRLRKDPNSYVNNGIDFYDGHTGSASSIDPTSIDWSQMSGKDMGRIRIVQSPGDHNALGRIRILMPNGYNIYMHDTNHQEYFVRDERTLSSGCIRLSEPRNIARFILSGNKGWTDNKMEEMISKGKMRDIASTNKFPVYIVYQTIWTDDRGNLVYGSDVYGRDKKILSALKGKSAYALPGNSRSKYAASDEL